MANLSRGQTLGVSEQVTNTKLHNLADLGGCSNIVNADIALAAAIAYTKLNLSGSIVTTDISASAGITASQTDTTTVSQHLVPTGGIIMWSGTIATIPTGWYLCDGSNSTPDLRNRFVVCANADASGVAKSTISGSAAQSGGSTTIDITQIPAHTHSVTILSGGSGTGNGGNSNTSTSTTGSSGGGLPYTQPYYALAFIMKG